MVSLQHRRFPREFRVRRENVQQQPGSSVTREEACTRVHAMCFMIKREQEGRGLTMSEWEAKCQVDIVDGDNAAEITGEQRGLMTKLLASERTNDLSTRASMNTNVSSLLSFLPYASASSIILSNFWFQLCLSPASFCGGGGEGQEGNNVTKTYDVNTCDP